MRTPMPEPTEHPFHDLNKNATSLERSLRPDGVSTVRYLSDAANQARVREGLTAWGSANLTTEMALVLLDGFETLQRVLKVHDEYFDLDEQAGGDSTPEPKDVWRFDRDFRAAAHLR
jgi:hypothetical protein